nr:retrotransposon protein, putative, Ty1-copia subclass [Tanacetum cinerariifolium]
MTRYVNLDLNRREDEEGRFRHILYAVDHNGREDKEDEAAYNLRLESSDKDRPRCTSSAAPCHFRFGLFCGCSFTDGKRLLLSLEISKWRISLTLEILESVVELLPLANVMVIEYNILTLTNNLATSSMLPEMPEYGFGKHLGHITKCKKNHLNYTLSVATQTSDQPNKGPKLSRVLVLSNVEPRRSKRAKVSKDFGPDYMAYIVIEKPQTYNAATESLKAPYWKEAIQSEIDLIVHNNTWKLVDLPSRHKPIGHKWIFKKKLRPNATHNLIIHQMDVKTVFLNGELDEEIYMKQPDGFVFKGQEHK